MHIFTAGSLGYGLIQSRTVYDDMRQSPALVLITMHTSPVYICRMILPPGETDQHMFDLEAAAQKLEAIEKVGA